MAYLDTRKDDGDGFDATILVHNAADELFLADARDFG